MSTPKRIDAFRLRRIIESCLRRELAPKTPLPPLDEDLIESGALDSMAWVGVIRCVEAATDVPDLGARLANSPASIAALLAALQTPPRRPQKQQQKTPGKPAAAGPLPLAHTVVLAVILGSGEALGSQVIPVAQIESEHGLPPGKLQNRAGIESVRRVAGPENEINLAVGAARAALKQSRAKPTDLDFLVVSSETSIGYPSLGAQLHSRLLARDTCGVLDVGGACLGLLNGFAVARSLIAAGSARRILVVTADVHSHLLAPGRVPGEFGGLFGDGASAFLVAAADGASSASYHLGEFIFGCAGAYAGAIRVGPASGGHLDLHFDGEALSRAALTRLERIIADLELRTGLHRDDAAAFATHQPNPRLVELLARQMEVPFEKFPVVARRCGNLGASTCGAALNQALTVQAALPAASRHPIFLASLGPGLLWGGGVLHPAGGEEKEE